MLAQGGDITANPGVALGTWHGAKAAGNLDADFHHPKGALRFVVGKGQLQFRQEGEDTTILAFQPIQQVLFFGLLGALLGALLRSDGVSSSAGAQDLPVALMPVVQLRFTQRRITSFSFLGAPEHLQEQIVKVLGPLLLMLLEEENQFPQQVTFAEGMAAILEAQIAGEEVMHQPAAEPGDDADRLNGVFAAGQLDAEKRQQRRA